MAAAAAPHLAAVTRVPAASLHLSKPTWWLESRFHFTFADWFEPTRMQFGALRVVNDDVVQPRSGFGAHPHRDAEIFSYVLSGRLTHADSLGNSEALGRGCVQYMSAGSGVRHSEMNEHDEPCRFLQVWLTPEQRGVAPRYGSTTYDAADRHNRLLHILHGSRAAPAGWTAPGCSSSKTAPRLHADANVYVSESVAHTAHALELGAGRQAYLVCMEGSLQANGQALVTRDAARIKGAPDARTQLALTAGDDGAHLLLLEMALSDD